MQVRAWQCFLDIRLAPDENNESILRASQLSQDGTRKGRPLQSVFGFAKALKSWCRRPTLVPTDCGKQIIATFCVWNVGLFL